MKENTGLWSKIVQFFIGPRAARNVIVLGGLMVVLGCLGGFVVTAAFKGMEPGTFIYSAVDVFINVLVMAMLGGVLLCVLGAGVWLVRRLRRARADGPVTTSK